ncbi:MAG TPA: hypothetical protein VN258_10330, partial [Mobilitalea sp.]|nr:hypothetical protein [Mobilitalea sp.]
MKRRNRILMLSLILIGLMMYASACKGKEKASENASSEDTAGTSEVTPAAGISDVTPAAGTTAVSAGDYDYSLVVNGSDSYDISDMLYGLFLEDINYAVDGGLYAEKIKNRSFEYGKMANNKEKCGWTILGDASFDII